MTESDCELSRRQWINRTACGFGALALSGLGAGNTAFARQNPLAPKASMLPVRAKRVIFVFMSGGPSHVDSFDYKPDLIKHHDQTIDFKGVRFGTFGKMSKRRLMKPLWRFRQYGECGQHVSELFPHMAKHVDKMCMINSMQTEGVAHGPSTLFLHTGATTLIRPSMGSWVTYGLGTENRNLPGFITIGPSPNHGGTRKFTNAFLPATFQGTAIGRAEEPTAKATIRNIRNRQTSAAVQKHQFDFLQKLNETQRRRDPANDLFGATIDAYDLANRMQQHAPGIMDLSSETQSTLQAYGIGEKATDDFGRQCLMARRLAEEDVRFIQINYADGSPNPRWDQHSNMPKHADHALATDQPVAALLEDLNQRGLLEDTLVWWGGEFGRTPFSQGKDGRDHNPRGFTVWLAGGGVKAGFSYGKTDEIGHLAVSDRVHMHDLHATILHQMGLDHERLTYRHEGRDFRLTDVAGNVIHDLLAVRHRPQRTQADARAAPAAADAG